MRIVGVVGDVKQGALSTQAEPHLYTAWAQGSDGQVAVNFAGAMRNMRLTLRGQVNPTTLLETVRARIRIIDPALPVTSVQTMTDIVRKSAAVPRFNALLL